MEKAKKKDIIKFVIFILFFVSVIVCSIVLAPKLKVFSDFGLIRDKIKSYKSLSFIAFIFLQILQVVVFVLPGDAVNMVGGFIFGIYMGSILSIIGVFIGTIIAFLLLDGWDMDLYLDLLNPKLESITHLLNSNAGTLSLFVICNLPFVPKDILMYCAGLTPVKPSRVLTIYCLSRIPGIMIWTSVGAQVYNQSILGLVITFAILAVFLMAIILLKRKIDKKRNNQFLKI